MDGPLSVTSMIEQDRRISEIVAESDPGCAISSAGVVPDPSDAEDIVQEVFYELVEANRLLIPSSTLPDGFSRRTQSHHRPFPQEEAGDLQRRGSRGRRRRAAADRRSLAIARSGRSALLRNVLLDELEFAIGELPDEQREVFVAHELEGRSFKELSAATGVSVNTLLSRKRYAVLHLRERLQTFMTNLRKHEEPNMKKKWIWIAPLAILAMALFVFLGGELVLHLWNWLLPPLFGWPRSPSGKRWDFLALCRILFGGWGGHGSPRSNIRDG